MALTFDRATFLPQRLRLVSAETAAVTMVDYSGWNIPVDISAP